MSPLQERTMVRTDNDLLASFAEYLRRSPAKRRGFRLHLAGSGFDSLAELKRVIELAEQKWLVENVLRSDSPGTMAWTFDLTTRGAEALQLD
jgi:hypothetical protein